MNVKKQKALIKMLLIIKLRYEYYKNVLLDVTYINLETNRIQGKIKETYRISKISLSCYDDKWIK